MKLKLGKTFSGLLMIVGLTFMGLALIWLPNWLMTNYERAQLLGNVWGTIYLTVVGIGIVLLVGSALWTVWKLWGASIVKKHRRARRNNCLLYTSPSPRDATLSRMPSSA